MSRSRRGWIEPRLGQLGIDIRQHGQWANMREYIRLLYAEIAMTQRFLNGEDAIPISDAEKVNSAIALLEYLHANCLVPDMAHDAIGDCKICRLLVKLKS